MKKLLQHFISLPIILIIAIMIVVVVVKTKAPIEHQDVSYPVKAVDVITVNKIPFRIRATAFGHVEPATAINAKSEVSGKISYIHPDLKQGASIKKGTVVLRIEPTTFEISLDKSKAGLKGSQSSLAQLEVEQNSTEQALVIAQKKLDVELKELARLQSLWEQRLIARTSLDTEQKNVLSLQQSVQDITGKLASFNSRKSVIKAQIQQSKSQVDQSQDTIGRTEVIMPFDARIGVVSVEKDEFTPAGSLLFEAFGMQAVEINAQLPTHQFRPLVSSALENVSPISLHPPENLQHALSNMQLETRIRLVGDMNNASVWQGKLTRISESIDPTRDTLGLVIVVENPYDNIIPGIRPPLLKGMYASVEILAPVKPMLVIPRKAVHQSRVYLVTAENTLTIRPVNVLFNQGELVVIAEQKQNIGIKEGEQLIISDVIPIIEGMPLKPIVATDYQQQLLDNALNEQR
ncbi:MAG: HlyD family secretion protein [Piscirickettsiaceae bacterium]|nr:HlyD family secretion protein [Piscirickettsiaceae bacterium]